MNTTLNNTLESVPAISSNQKSKYNIICESDEDDFENILNYEPSPSSTTPQILSKTPILNHQNNITIIQLPPKTPTTPLNEDEISKKYFEIDLPSESSFFITKDDWKKLKSIQKGHRFLRGEWEDYFIMGMKESNKYCVFAFKDHYVHQSCIRSRRNKKYFSANGYCVFENCDVKFTLKMSEACKIIVNYTGKLKHCVNEVHARYFRGKSRQELKEVLKHTTPMREYLNRIQNADNEQIFAGNADFIGRSTAVYRRIASEAKDVYQSLLLLRLQLIEKTKSNVVPGFIQLIQHIPGCIVCFNELQIKLLFNLSPNFTIFISSIDSMVNTTINGKNLIYYEICIQNPLDPCKNQLLPLSCMLTVNNDNEISIKNWLRMILDAQYSSYYAFNSSLNYEINSKYGYFICNNSYVIIKSIINELMGIGYLNYLNSCFDICQNGSNYDGEKFYVIHVCTKQILNLIKKLCLINYEKINLKFGIYAFSIAVNCKTLDELKQVLYSLFFILESKYLNKNVENLFNFLKDKLNQLQKKFDSNGVDYDTYDDDDDIGGFTFNKLNINNDDYTAGSYSNVADVDSDIEAYYSHEMMNLKQKSKFTHFVQAIYESVKVDIEDLNDITIKILNPRYCPKLAVSFIDNLGYNIPLWSKIMQTKVGEDNKMGICTLKKLNERFSLLKSLLAHEKDSLDIFLNRLYNENNDLLNDLFSNQVFIERFIKYDVQASTGQALNNGSYLTNNILYTATTASSSGNDLIRLTNSRKKRKIEEAKIVEDEEEEEENDEDDDEIIIERSAQILSNLFGVDLIKDDLDTLDNDYTYLSSNIVEFYLKMIEYKANNDNLTFYLYVYPIDFYASLKYGYGSKISDGSNGLITQMSVNLFDYKLVIVPIQKSEHWSLAMIDFIKQKITYFDSLLINDYDCLKYLM
jgi:hypothetical protein